MVEKSRQWEPVADSTRLDGPGNGEGKMWTGLSIYWSTHPGTPFLPPSPPPNGFIARQADHQLGTRCPDGSLEGHFTFRLSQGDAKQLCS